MKPYTRSLHIFRSATSPTISTNSLTVNVSGGLIDRSFCQVFFLRFLVCRVWREFQVSSQKWVPKGERTMAKMSWIGYSCGMWVYYIAPVLKSRNVNYDEETFVPKVNDAVEAATDRPSKSVCCAWLDKWTTRYCIETIPDFRDSVAAPVALYRIACWYHLCGNSKSPWSGKGSYIVESSYSRWSESFSWCCDCHEPFILSSVGGVEKKDEITSYKYYKMNIAAG